MTIFTIFLSSFLLVLSSLPCYAAKRFAVEFGSNAALQVAPQKGTATDGHCVKYDSNGNIVDSGSACGSSGSSQWTGTSPGPIYYNTGNVGVGSTNPGQILDVVGTIRTTDFITTGPYTDLRAISGATPNDNTVDNQPFITTCLASLTTSTCYIPPGKWYIDTEIAMPSSGFYSGGKILLLDPNAIIEAFPTYQTDPGNHGAVILQGNKSKVISLGGGMIDVSEVSGGYTGALLYNFSGQQASNSTGAYGLQLRDDNHTATGILMYADSNDVGIFANNYHDIIMYGMFRAINLSASADFGSLDSVNSNNFSNIILQNPIVGLYLDQGTGAGGQEVYGNTFTNIYIESYSGTTTGVYCTGWNNFFSQIQLWDIPGGQTGYNFTSTSAYNHFETWQEFIDDGGSPPTNIDLGTHNNIIRTSNPTFWGNVGIGVKSNSSNSLNVNAAVGGVAIGPSSYYNTTAPVDGLIVFGAVGIGTSKPASNAVLSVSGRLNVGTAAYLNTQAPANGMIMSGNMGIGTNVPAANGLSVVGGEALGSAAYTASVAPSNGLIVSGNVGIATFKPSSNLSINGGASIGNGNYAGLYVPTNGQLFVSSNIGIGTFAPGSVLSVAGGVSIGSNAFAGITEGTGKMIVSGNIGIGTSLTTNTLTISGAASIGTAASAGLTAPSNGLIVTGNTGIGSTNPNVKLDVTGTVRTTDFTLSGQTPVAGYVLTAVDSTGMATWTLPTSGSGTVNSGTANQVAYYASTGTAVSGNAGFVFNGSNVGIGSLTPGQKLDVNGTIRSTQFIDTGVTASSLVKTDINQQFSAATSGSDYAPATSGSSVLYGNGAGGFSNVSIGTGMLFSGGTLSTTITNQTSANPSATIGLSAVNGSAGTFTTSDSAPALSQGISPTWTGNHIFAPSSGNTLFTAGNVGIATVTPNNALDIVGSVGIGTFGASSFITSSPPAGSMQIEGNVGIGTVFMQSAALTVMNGNVGIGTWKPGATFSVGSTFSVTTAGTTTVGQLQVSGTNAIMKGNSTASGSNVTLSGPSNANSFLTLKPAAVTSNGGHVDIAVGNVGIGTITAFTVIDGGNVGIGSLTPGSTLDIQGTVRASGFSGQVAGTILCVKTGGGIGYCSGVIAGISCTCN